MADDGQAVIVTTEHLLQPLRPFEEADLSFDTNLAQLRGDDFPAPARVGWRRQLEGGAEALGIARLSQQVAGQRRVKGCIGGQVDIVGIVGRKVAADGRAVAEHGAVNDRLPVDGVAHGLADPNVVEGRLLIVHGEDGLTLGIAGEHGEARVALELGEVFRGRIAVEGIDVARQHGRVGCRRLGDELEGRRFQRRGLTPVVGIAAQADLVAPPPLLEAEGTGADGQVLDVPDALGRDHDRVAPGEVEQKIPLRRGEVDAHAAVAQRFHAFDPGEQCLLRVGRILGPGAIE